MKQYKVLKDLINAPVGTILRDGDNGCNTLYLVENSSNIGRIVDGSQFNQSIAQKFIEPYAPEPKHWRARKQCSYYFIDNNCIIIRSRDDHEFYDNLRYESNNYFKSQATAELVAKARKLELEWLHDTDAFSQRYCAPEGITSNLIDAMDEAREAVLEDDSNE